MTKKVIINLIKVVFTLLFIFLLINMIDIKMIVELYKKLSISTVLVCVGLYFIINISRSGRFLILFEKRLKIFRLLPVVLIHGFYNRVLPFRIGEGAFPYYVKQQENIDFSESLACILIVRIFDLLSSILLFICAYLLIKNKLIASIILTGAIFLCCIFFFPVLMLLAEKVISRFDKLNKYKIVQLLQRIIETKRKRLSFKTNLYLLILSILNWCIMFLIFSFLFKNFQILIPFNEVVMAGSFSNLSSILPISSIGNFGTMELGWSAILVNLGYNTEVAMLSGVSINLFTFTCIAVLGVVGLILIKVTKKRGIHNDGT